MTNTGFRHEDKDKICLFIIGDTNIKFQLIVNEADIRKPKIREIINAWAVGLVTIPESGISISEVESFLDFLDQIFPIEKESGLRKSKFRIF